VDKIRRTGPPEFIHLPLFLWADSPDRKDASVGIGPLEQYHPDWNRGANQGDEIARESGAGAFPVSLETL
jgi:hypothetical protein